MNVPGNDLNLGKVYSWILKYLVPAEFMTMFGWWMYQAATVDGWWDPRNALSVGTCLLQWGMALSVLIYFNKQIATASLRGEADEA